VRIHGRVLALLVVVAELDEDVVARPDLLQQRVPAPLRLEAARAPAVAREVHYTHPIDIEVLLQRLTPACFRPAGRKLLRHRRIARQKEGDGVGRQAEQAAEGQRKKQEASAHLGDGCGAYGWSEPRGQTNAEGRSPQ